MKRITIAQNGPYLVEGGVPLAYQHIAADEDGESLGWRAGDPVATGDKYALCRCGHSAKKPFCDGSHKRVGFDGSETASRAPFAEQAERIDGPTLLLDDAERLCAFARFCDRAGKVWNLVGESDPQSRATAVEEAGCCPSGRLVVRDKNGAALEPTLDQSIGLVEDTAEEVSGPLWIRGGIPVVAADGFTYEVRNRVTLCRCGASSNKPFCDGSHATIRFDDKK